MGRDEDGGTGRCNEAVRGDRHLKEVVMSSIAMLDAKVN